MSFGVRFRVWWHGTMGVQPVTCYRVLGWVH